MTQPINIERMAADRKIRRPCRAAGAARQPEMRRATPPTGMVDATATAQRSAAGPQCRLALAIASLFLSTLACADSASVAYSDAGPAVIMGASNMGTDSNHGALYLDVTLNGRPTGKLVQFTERGGQIRASQSALAQLGIRVPDGLPDPLALASLPGARADYDAANQHLDLVVPVALLNAATSVLNRRDQTTPRATASPGLLLNYDLYASQGNAGSTSVSSFTELRAFGNVGLFDSSFLLQANHGHGNGWNAKSVRLDSFYRRSFPAHMLTLTIGDTLTGALNWSRPTRIAGIQLARNFGLQPYHITTPIPVFMGQASTPSQVELYVNGMQQYSGKVEPGPFQLHGSPVITGSGEAQVVLTDAFGRATTLDFPFYTTDQLLQAGLSDWTASLGVVRRGYGVRSFDYGNEPAVDGTWRYGVNDRLTARIHGEAIAGLSNAGAGGALLLGHAGVVHGSWAHSSNRVGSGSLTNIGYSWRGGPFNLSLDSTRTHGQWRDVASRYGSLPPRVSERALAGFTSARAGSFSVSYLNLRYPEQPGARYANGFWSRAFGRLSMNLSVNQNLDQRSDRSVFLGVAWSLGDRLQLGASAQHDHGRTRVNINAAQPIPGDGGFGWRSQAQLGDDNNGGMAEAGYRGRYGKARGGISSNDGHNQAYADVTGSLVLMGGHGFAARRVDNAFAVVSTDGIADVPVKLENRVIGHTDRHGMLLVTPLNAWQKNQLAIDPMDLPVDVRIDNVNAVATPRDSAGILVRFGITPVRAASVVLVDETGAPLPVGSRVRVAGQTDHGAIVGFDGIVYLDTLAEHTVLDVQTDAGTCRIALDYPPHGGAVPQLGPFTCHTGALP